MILPHSFFQRDALIVAPELLGKYLVRQHHNTIEKYEITEIEVYRGEKDLACHCRKGRTPRTQVMYEQGATIYIYLIYGMYYMLNIVTGQVNEPQAILIRGVKSISGPGRLTKKLGIDKSLHNHLIGTDIGLWIEESNQRVEYLTTPRIGIEYAQEWKHKLWRFVCKE